MENLEGKVKELEKQLDKLGDVRLTNNKKIYKVSVILNGTEILLEHYFEAFSSATRYTHALNVFCGQHFNHIKFDSKGDKWDGVRLIYTDESEGRRITVSFDEVVVDAYDAELTEHVKGIITQTNNK